MSDKFSIKEKMELLEEWRDYHWQMFIRSVVDPDMPGTQHRDKAEALDLALRILDDDYFVKPVKPKYIENLKFGQYYENFGGY